MRICLHGTAGGTWPQPCPDLRRCLTPVPTGHGCVLPSRCLLLPAGILLASVIHRLLLPPTDTHPMHVFPMSASMCSSFCWASEAKRRFPVFPHHREWDEEAPCTAPGTGPSAPETRSSPEPSQDFVCPCSERCLLRLRWRHGR